MITWFINMNCAGAALEVLSENWLVESILYSTKWLLIIPFIVIKPKWIILHEDTKRVTKGRLWCYPVILTNVWLLMWIYAKKVCLEGLSDQWCPSLSAWLLRQTLFTVKKLFYLYSSLDGNPKKNNVYSDLAGQSVFSII